MAEPDELVVQDLRLRNVTEREARLGEERDAGRPHRVASDDGEAVGSKSVENRLCLVEHARRRVQRGEPRAPQHRGIGHRGDRPEDRRDLRQASLGPADGEHLEAIHAGVVRGLVGGADGLGPFGGRLSGGEVTGGQCEHGLVGVRHEDERGKSTDVARGLMTSERHGGLVEPTERDQPAYLGTTRVRRTPRIAQPFGEITELGRDGELAVRVVDGYEERLESDQRTRLHRSPRFVHGELGGGHAFAGSPGEGEGPTERSPHSRPHR
jgi:hypothetical protein